MPARSCARQPAGPAAWTAARMRSSSAVDAVPVGLEEARLLGGELLVERRARDAGGADDVGDGRGRVARARRRRGRSASRTRARWRSRRAGRHAAVPYGYARCTRKVRVRFRRVAPCARDRRLRPSLVRLRAARPPPPARRSCRRRASRGSARHDRAPRSARCTAARTGSATCATRSPAACGSGATA